ncbi:MAG: metallophosphoesterase family protein [Acutalibacteraceae bacterium]
MMKNSTKLTFIADTHHFSRTLSDGGKAYALRSGSDQKCLEETGGIIDAAFSHIANSDTQAVMIAGDLTNNGERVSHEEFRNKLYALQKSKPVYVITATHDWCCDENPRRFDGEKVYHDVPVLKPQELRDFYYDFGPKQCNAEFITHLTTCSYTVDVGKNVRILALNDDQNGKGRAGFKEDHFQWIEEQIKKAKADGKVLIGMEHHLLIAHIHPLIMGGSTCVGDREEVASRLADAGLRYMFVGHSHIQAVDSFTSAKGNTITEVNVGSLCGYPSPIVNVTVSDDGLEISTDCVQTFIHDGKVYDTKEYLANKACALVDRVLECATLEKSDFIERLDALQLDGKKLGKLYPVAKPVLKFISNADVDGLYKLLHIFRFDKDIDKRSVSLLSDKKITEFIHEILLSALDGSANRITQDSSYYRVCMGAAACLQKIYNSKLANDIKQTLHNILTGGEYNINHCKIQ